MIVSLSGWETKGLRCPDTKVDFIVDGKHKRINLVQMPNGTGKSTIIKLISEVLNGKIRFWEAKDISEFSSISLPVDSGLFVLRLLIEDKELNTRKNIVFQVDLDFSTNRLSISSNSNPASGLEEGWRPPRELVSFLNPRCVEVFVFQGDKVSNLIEQGRDEAEASIQAFFGISHIGDLEHDIEENFKGRQTGISTTGALNKRSRVLDSWSDWLKTLENAEKQLEDELEPVRASYDTNKVKVENILSGQDANSQALEQYRETEKKTKQILSDKSREAFDALRNPFYISKKISNRMNELRENLVKLKLPGTSGEFFKELASDSSCICGRPLDEHAKKSILDNAKTFLSDQHIDVINGIKGDTQTYSEKAEQQQKVGLFDQLMKAKIDYKDAATKLQRHLKRMEDEASDQEKALLKEYNDTRDKKNEIEGKLKHLRDDTGSVQQASSQIPKLCKKIPIVKKVIEIRQKELAEASDTVEEFESKEKLKRILASARTIALKNIKDTLTDQSNSRLKQILPKGTSLEIIEIDKNIQLGFNGKKQASGSGGQNVSVAYSFATSILERSGAQFPLVVDHPVTALQESARRGLGENLAKICHQFIGFIIDTEKTGFVDSLERVKNEVNYITIFKKIEGNQPYIDQLPTNKSQIYESDDGVVCSNKEFFYNFRDLDPGAVSE